MIKFEEELTKKYMEFENGLYLIKEYEALNSFLDEIKNKVVDASLMTHTTHSMRV